MKFFSFWDGSKLSLYERLCENSFHFHGHELNIYTYAPEILENTTNALSADLIVSRKIFHSFHKISAFANYFRYVALRDVEKDSIWVDMDVLCLSPSWPVAPFIAGFETRHRINNAVLKIPHDSEMLSFLIKNSIGDNYDKYGTTGPFLLTSAINKFRMNYKVFSKQYFYPMGHWELDLLIDPNKLELARTRFRDSLSVHLYNQLLIRAAIPKNMLPPAGSFLHAQIENMVPDVTGFNVLGEDWLKGWRRNFYERKTLNQLSKTFGPLKPLIKSRLRLE